MCCERTKKAMAAQGIEFVEVDVTLDENAAARSYIVDGLGYSEAPVVVVDDEDHWSGFRPDQINRLAKRAILPSDATREARSPAR